VNTEKITTDMKSFRLKQILPSALFAMLCLMFSCISYAQTTSTTTDIGYFYSASGTIVDAEDNTGAMSSYLTRSMRYNGTDETFAVSNIKDIAALVDADGNVLNKYNYTAYGVPTSYSSTSVNSTLKTQNSTLSLSSNPYTYSNYYTDSESGNYYLNARYYDPTLGIFLTSDTYNLPNRYMYVNGNPVMGVDPTGHVNLTVDDWNAFFDGENHNSNQQNIQKNPTLLGSKTFVGKGDFGVVYEQKDDKGERWASKEYTPYPGYDTFEGAKKQAEMWNKYYSGRTLETRKLDVASWGRHKNVVVRDMTYMPYIDGIKAKTQDDYMKGIVSLLARGMNVFSDLDKDGNLKMVNGQPFVIDFDQAEFVKNDTKLYAGAKQVVKQYFGVDIDNYGELNEYMIGKGYYEKFNFLPNSESSLKFNKGLNLMLLACVKILKNNIGVSKSIIT